MYLHALPGNGIHGPTELTQQRPGPQYLAAESKWKPHFSNAAATWPYLNTASIWQTIQLFAANMAYYALL